MDRRITSWLAAVAVFILIGVLTPFMFYPMAITIITRRPYTLHIGYVETSLGPFILVLPAGADTIVAISLVVTGISAAIYLAVRDRYIHVVKLRAELMRFISTIHAMVRSQVSVLDALREAANMVGEPLASYIKRFVSLVRLGEDPHRAIDKVFKNVPSEVKLLASSLAIAMVSGGHVSEVLRESDVYVQQLQRMDYIRLHRLSEQKFVALMAVLTFAASGATVIWLIGYLAPRLATLPGARMINVQFVASSYFLASLVMLIIASFVVSRIVSGTFVLAPKYIALIAPLLGAIFAFASSGLMSLLIP